MEAKTLTVSTLSASSLTAYLQNNLSSEYVLIIVAISSIIGMILTVVYYNNKKSTLLAFVGCISALFAFLPIYMYIAKIYGDITGFFASLFITFSMPFIVVYSAQSKLFKVIFVLFEEYLINKVKKMLQK
tara:strand:- start:402 stop:791 length:390 start_codon:yes stop_codon:yes gene_type:complete